MNEMNEKYSELRLKNIQISQKFFINFEIRINL